LISTILASSGGFFRNRTSVGLPSISGFQVTQISESCSRALGVHPHQLDAGLGLDAVDVMAKADELVLDPPVFGPDVLLADVEVSVQPGLRPDRGLHLGHRTVVERVHELTPADDHPLLARCAELIGPHRRHLGEAARLARAASAVGSSISSSP
jgi:hypothetical protein